MSPGASSAGSVFIAQIVVSPGEGARARRDRLDLEAGSRSAWRR